MNPSDDRYRALRQLPSFPAIATKLLGLLSHEDVHIKQIVELIRSDTALTAELLRVVNSPVYGFAARIGSLQNAITVLGLQTVKSLAVTVSMKGFLHTALRIDLLRRIWRHGLACGLVCDDLSAVCSTNQAREDRAYTAGLLHNIGALGLFVAHPRTYGEVLEAAKADDLLERERKTFGIDHCGAGGWLVHNWGLPDELREVAASHHEAPRPSGFELIDLVRVGVLMTDALGFDFVSSTSKLTMADLRGMLPHSAQYRFDPDQEAMVAKITARLDSFD